MTNYAKALAVFQDGVMSRDTKAALKLIKRARDNEFPQDIRLSVYSNAYKIRLIEATEVDYGALKHYLGEKKFDKAIGTFVETTPSTFWDLNIYPITFANFMHTYTDDVFAQEITRLEAMITDVFWGSESTPLAPDYLSRLEPEEFEKTVLEQRAASHLLAFDYPVNSYLTAYRDGEKPKKPARQKQYIYLYRYNDKATREVLDAAAFLLLQLLFAGKSVGQALETLITTRPDLADHVAQHLSGWFKHWFEKEFFA